MLGLGVPTTANYVLVATLMAPVVVELGAQAGLVIPLIAVHLFVFYYGIMGDITPPVGLATFAAAAISGEDAIATGVQGSVYALRTVILPFIWIFNPQLLLIDIDSIPELVSVVVASTIAMLIFAAVTMNWFRVKCRLWEVALLARRLRAAVPARLLHGLPGARVHAPAAGEDRRRRASDLPDGGRLVLAIKGTTIEGDDVTKTVAVRLGPAGDDGRKRLAEAGLTLAALGDAVQISGVKFGSRAKKSGFEQGWDIARIEVPSGRADAALVLPAGVPADRAGVVVAGSADAPRTRSPPPHDRRRAARRADPRPRALGRADQRRVRAGVARVHADEPARRQPVGRPRARAAACSTRG